MRRSAPNTGGKSEGKKNEHSSVIYFRGPEILGAFQELSAKDVDFVDEPHLITEMPDHELWMVFFHDPSGIILALMAEIPL